MNGTDGGDEKSLILHAERAQVEKRKVVTGRTRISTRTLTRDEMIDERLEDEQAQVERVACNRYVDEMPSVREAGDMTIVPVVEEVLVVERRLFLKEEIHIRRVRSERRHQETVTLREQHAIVENLEPNAE